MRWLALLTALGLAVLTAATAFTRIAFACAMSGEVGERCHCHAFHGSSAEPAPADEAELDSDPLSCCSPVVQSASDVGAATVVPSPELQGAMAPPVMPFERIERTHAPARVDGFIPAARGPPPRKLPLYLQHSSLLN
jgi:hypothetical protein